MNFASDNAAAIAPQILDAIGKVQRLRGPTLLLHS